MKIVGETGAQQTVGYVVGIEDGCVRVTLEVTEAHGNRHGVLHGGFISLLLDNAMGVACSLTVSPNGRAPFMTISLNTQFHAPAHVSDRVIATAEVIGGGRSLVFCRGELRTEGGTVVASTTGIFKRVTDSALQGHMPPA